MRLPILIFFVSFASLTTRAQQSTLSLIPWPVEVKQQEGSYPLKSRITVSNTLPSQDWPVLLKYFTDEMRKQFGIIVTEAPKGKKGDIDFSMKRMPTSGKPSYTLTVSKDGVSISSNFNEPAFNAMQTFFQLVPVDPKAKKEIPFVDIFDYPRFAYRGLHLDVSRHFFPVDYVKKYIDYIAMHKMNYFHWHLTDDQGWRIEIKKYPKLTSVGGWRDGTIIGRYPGTGNDHIHYGGFYTQEQIKEVVKYAADRYITVIPEIEMPGHSMAALTAYPELGTTPDSVYKVSETWGINGVYNNVLNPSENTFTFLQDVLDEVMALFPSPYIHIGGDECDKQWWKKSAFCQQLMKEKGIKDEHGLQSYFIQRIEKYVNSKGRKIIGWDEILEGGLAPNAIVMSWQGEKGGIEAAKQNHDVVMTPGNPVYFDHTQGQNEDSVTIGGYNPIENVYAYEPVPKELNAEQAKHVLGAQANMWTEYMGNRRKVEYMLFPRLDALSEVLWSPKEKRNWDDFQTRLQAQFKRYDQWRLNYSKAYFDLQTKVLPGDKNEGLKWEISKRKNDAFTIEYSHPVKAAKADTFAIYSLTDPTKIVRYQTYKPGDIYFSTTPALADLNKDKIILNVTEPGDHTLKAFHIKYATDHLVSEKNPFTILNQKFSFNKATGKKITLKQEASDKYPGDGAFTLVNGVINEKGFARSREFIGFNGTDCEAVIDLGESQLVSFVVINSLNKTSSWIWRPAKAEVFGSGDGKTWYPLKSTDVFDESKDGTGKGKMTLSFKATYAQYVKVVITNYGTIPAGNPGAGNKPWLFVDEIEVEGPEPEELRSNN